MLAEGAAVAAPLIVLSVARLLLGSAPESINAQGAVPTPAPLVAPAAKPLSAEQQRAAAWVKGLTTGAPLRSPMDHPTPYTRAQPEPEPAPRPAPDPVPIPVIAAADPLSGLTLTGVLGNDTGGLAAVNGRIYKVGDRIRGMAVTAIDIKNNVVELTTSDGVVLRLKRDHQ
jgi:hypothetical protein